MALCLLWSWDLFCSCALFSVQLGEKGFRPPQVLDKMSRTLLICVLIRNITLWNHEAARMQFFHFYVRQTPFQTEGWSHLLSANTSEPQKGLLTMARWLREHFKGSH